MGKEERPHICHTYLLMFEARQLAPEYICTGRNGKWGNFVLKVHEAGNVVIGTTIPEAERCLWRAPLTCKLSWRKTETTSDLRMCTAKASRLTVFVCLLTSFFCEKIAQVLLTRRMTKRGHILEFSCYSFFLLNILGL